MKRLFVFVFFLLSVMPTVEAGLGYLHRQLLPNGQCGDGTAYDYAIWDNVSVSVGSNAVPGDYGVILDDVNALGAITVTVAADGSVSWGFPYNPPQRDFVYMALGRPISFSVPVKPSQNAVCSVSWENMFFGGDACDGHAPYPIHGLVTITIGDALPDEGHTKTCDATTSCPDCSKSQPMAQYSIHLMLASLHITDTPISYNSPRGPSTDFTVIYNQREANQPSPFPFSNFGPKWTFNWLSYVTDDPATPSANAAVYARGGGTEKYTNFNSATQSYAADKQTLAVLVRTATGYEKRFPDGSKEVFSQSDGSTSYPRRIFLTSVVDAPGNATTLTYDSNFRVTAITDSLGQATTLTYPSTGDILKVTKVTDPFGRFATFDYTDGQLTRITDPVGIKSEFEYEAGTDFINAMVTPYGRTTFAKGGTGSAVRWLEATDPLLGKERVEYNNKVTSIPDSESTAPSNVRNANLRFRNTFYWNKKAMEEAPGDYSKAQVIRWALNPDGKVSGIKTSEKKPLESRIWYNYEGQGDDPELVGVNAQAIRAARLLDDGSTQLWQYKYNSLGKVTKVTDPATPSRVTSYKYATNDIDLLDVFQQRAGGASTDPFGVSADKIASYTYDPAEPPHLPHIYTDPAGQTTTYHYNPQGQILTITNAKNETTTYAYGNGTAGHPLGYLDSITSPQVNGTSAVRSFLYDNGGLYYTTGANRVICVIDDPDHYVVEYGYDKLDRVTSILYPDGSEAFDYVDPVRGMTLDVTKSFDRRGRLTTMHYDANRHMDSITDPLQRTTSYGWCTCGALESITDANMHTATFTRDLQSRVTRKTFPATTTPLSGAPARFIDYTYENTTSRLKSMTDARHHRTNYLYNLDDTLSEISYTDTSGTALNPATPTVSFAYDDSYSRVRKMTTAGLGDTNYTYYPVNPSANPPILGANQLHTVGGLLANDSIEYGYDELGRAISQKINGASNESTMNYDSLGRLSATGNPLGSFTREYDGVTGRLTDFRQVSATPAIVTHYSYFGNSGGQRLQTLENQSSSGALLSKFDYVHDPEGQITTWTKQIGASPALSGIYTYNLADELTKATTAALTPPANFVYDYDLAGNRKTDQQGTITHTFNEVNEITDPGFVYDNNGNLTSDGVNTYEWDAANRLVAIQTPQSAPSPSIPPLPSPPPAIPPPALDPPVERVTIATPLIMRSEFSYDGLARRVRIIEKQASGVDGQVPPEPVWEIVSDHRYVWSGNRLAEERHGANPATVTKRFFAEGEQRIDGIYYYTRDHLGSIRELLDATGAVRAQYEYDPYGVRTKISGDLDASFGFTGHWHHAPSGLNLSLYRAYSPRLGRWISRDPIGEQGGLNLYEYTWNDPLNWIDELGLEPGARFYIYCKCACDQDWRLVRVEVAPGLGGNSVTYGPSTIHTNPDVYSTALHRQLTDPYTPSNPATTRTPGADRGSQTLAHECGHTCQAKILGPVYLPTAGLNSLLEILTGGYANGLNGLRTPTERGASQNGMYGGFATPPRP